MEQGRNGAIKVSGVYYGLHPNSQYTVTINKYGGLGVRDSCKSGVTGEEFNPAIKVDKYKEPLPGQDLNKGKLILPLTDSYGRFNFDEIEL